MTVAERTLTSGKIDSLKLIRLTIKEQATIEDDPLLIASKKNAQTVTAGIIQTMNG